MMDIIDRDELKELMQKRDEPCVSIFLPTHRAGREIEQDPIRLDNLLRRAEKELIDQGIRSPNVKELLSPAYNLAKDGFFTRNRADGLAIFTAAGLLKHYRAPIHFQELLVVGKRFLFKPLVPILNSGNRFHILAVSRKSVRLLQCTEYGVSEVELEGVPRNMEEALGYDDTEARLLFRTVPQASNVKGVPMFHGHGGGIESDKEYLYNYFRKLRDSLHPFLRDERSPLVFAGVEYLFPIFKHVNFYRNILNEAVEGNPDDLDALELHRRALRIVIPVLSMAREEAIRRISDASCNGHCSFSLEKILPAALEGRIDTLLVDVGAHKWGKYDPASRSVEIHDAPSPGDEDLLDLATVATFMNGGTIYPLQTGMIPGSGAISALFRY